VQCSLDTFSTPAAGIFVPPHPSPGREWGQGGTQGTAAGSSSWDLLPSGCSASCGAAVRDIADPFPLFLLSFNFFLQSQTSCSLSRILTEAPPLPSCWGFPLLSYCDQVTEAGEMDRTQAGRQQNQPWGEHASSEPLPA
jgi:hypothetical protein